MNDKRLTIFASQNLNSRRSAEASDRVAFWGRRASFLLITALLLGCVAWLLSVAAQEGPTQSTIPSSPQSIFLPYIGRTAPLPVPAQCPTQSDRVYELILVDGPPADRIDYRHADLNLSMRSYRTTQQPLELVNINGPTDQQAPQLPGLFQDRRTATFLEAYQVYDWNWGCGADGCRGGLLSNPAVTMVGVEMADNEPVSIPSRGPEIMQGGFVAMVLYAEEGRITLGYTRHDSVAPGYAVHLENLCVDPNLLALYQQANQDGRGRLPALKVEQILGTVSTGQLLVAIRDRGTFMDPRSRKDWWHGR